MSLHVDPGQAPGLFSLISDPIRLGVLAQLSMRASSRQELADALLTSRAVLEKHLERLKDGGLVVFDRQARLYRIGDREALRRLHRAVPEILPAPLPLPDEGEA